MIPCRWSLWSHFHCFKQDWQYPTSIYLVPAAQRSRSDRCGEGDWFPLALPLPLHLQDFLVPGCPCGGTWLALDLLPSSCWATNHPAEWEPGLPGEWALDHRIVAALISPAAWEQMKVSHLSECRLHPHALFTASYAKWLVWFADAEQPDLSSKVSAKPTSFDSKKTWLLPLLKCQHMDFRH